MNSRAAEGPRVSPRTIWSPSSSLVAVLLASCISGPGSDAFAGEESVPISPTQEELWTISESPVFEVGADPASVPLWRVWDAERLTNGSVVVDRLRFSGIERGALVEVVGEEFRYAVGEGIRLLARVGYVSKCSRTMRCRVVVWGRRRR